MPKITYITPGGESVVVEAAKGNLMSAAVANKVDGISGNCGGVAACGTCHVKVEPEWLETTGPATDDEQEILEFEDDAADNSRLGCQVKITPELDGLVVRVVGA